MAELFCDICRRHIDHRNLHIGFASTWPGPDGTTYCSGCDTPERLNDFIYRRDVISKREEEKMSNLGLSEAEKWHYITTTLWQLSYPRMLEWLGRYETLNQAFEAAQRERDGMVAT